MPDGVTHFAAGVCAGGMAAVALDWFAGAAVAVPFAIGCGVGLLITPDLDLEGATFTEQALRRIPVVGWMYQAAFYPYAMAFKHRGLSHNLLLGTVTRIAYVAALAFVMLALASGVASWTGRSTIGWPQEMAASLRLAAQPAILLGWWFQDACHLALDWLF